MKAPFSVVKVRKINGRMKQSLLMEAQVLFSLATSKEGFGGEETDE